MARPRIAVTMGDPAGIGPEICLDLLNQAALLEEVSPIIFGDLTVLQHCAAQLGKPLNAPTISVDGLGELETGAAILDLAMIAPSDFEPGQINAATGASSYQYLIRAIDEALAGSVDGLATAPINKEAIHLAGVTQHPGHTEILGERTGTDRFCMMLTSDIITTSFVTVHVGYHEVPELLTTERIVEVIDLTRAAMKRLRGREPKLVVCGLNPHAGEKGLFGNREEERIIEPAIEQARVAGAVIEGPLPPDTSFLDWRRAETDAYICMYHDQGLIPLKALAFDKAINTTLGLPIVRTSVDHGTALDIAWQSKAKAQSLVEAVRLAAKLATDR